MCAKIELNGQISQYSKLSCKASRQAYKRCCWALPWRTERTWKLTLQLSTVCYKLGKLSFVRPLLRISEALAVEARDLSLSSDQPTIRVRQGKGSKARIVPVHAELHAALTSALQFGNVGEDDRLVRTSRSTADRWIKAAAARAEELGAIPPGRHISNHTLRHSYARHLLVHGIPINYLSRWLGHSSIQTTLIYLDLVPDPTGSLAAVP